MFIATNALNIVFVYLYFPETKHKSLEEIGRLFGDTNVRTYVSNTSTTMLEHPVDDKDKHSVRHHDATPPEV